MRHYDVLLHMRISGTNAASAAVAESALTAMHEADTMAGVDPALARASARTGGGSGIGPPAHAGVPNAWEPVWHPRTEI